MLLKKQEIPDAKDEIHDLKEGVGFLKGKVCCLEDEVGRLKEEIRCVEDEVPLRDGAVDGYEERGVQCVWRAWYVIRRTAGFVWSCWSGCCRFG